MRRALRLIASIAAGPALGWALLGSLCGMYTMRRTEACASYAYDFLPLFVAVGVCVARFALGRMKWFRVSSEGRHARKSDA
jgi:hypothetical protein